MRGVRWPSISEGGLGVLRSGSRSWMRGCRALLHGEVSCGGQFLAWNPGLVPRLETARSHLVTWFGPFCCLAGLRTLCIRINGGALRGC